MLPFKAIVALLSVGAVSTLPASHAFDKRATACKSGDKNFKALRNHKVDGSAFCSAYLQITRTSTITPVASTAATKWVTKSARMVVIQRVHFIVKHISRLKVMRTAVMTLTKTKTASVTSFRTKTVTGAQTDKIMKIDTYQVTKTDTDQFTKRVTRHFTTTVTAIVYTTSTKDITSTSTLQLTEEAPTTITVTSTEEAATGTVLFAYNCGVKNPITARYGFARNFALHNFDSCKRFCSGVNALSFAYSTNQCLCFSVLSYVNLVGGPNAIFTFSDMACLAETEPLKRAVKVNKRVPAYLPLKDDKDVSRACSCHITNKQAAPVTSTIIAPNAKAATVTSHTKVYDKIKKRVTVTFHRKIYLTNFKTTTKTDYITMTVTNRRDAMVTHPVIVTVTHVKTVTITNVNSVQVTNYNTVYTTKFDTASETDTETEIVTDVEYFTITEYETIPVTVTKAEVIVPSPVTVFMATTTNYG